MTDNEEKEIVTEDDVRDKIIDSAIKTLGNPFRNLTVKDVAEDLKMGEAMANKIFKREDFPSVNIGKTKTVTLLAYLEWKMKRRE